MKLHHRILWLLVLFLVGAVLLIYISNVHGYHQLLANPSGPFQSLQARYLPNPQQPCPTPANVTSQIAPTNATDPCPVHNEHVHNSVSDSRFQNPAIEKLFNKIFVNPKIDIDSEQFTIVILTYKRVALLRMVIPHYCSTGPRLQKVVIIWNDVGTKIPEDLKKMQCAVPLEFIESKENKLTNRFIPYPEIETDAVFFIDDDRKLLHEDLIFAFQSWQQFRHRILGYEQRLHTIEKNGQYFYGEKDNALEKYGYSLVLSTNFILHRAYLEMYQLPDFLPPGIYKYVDEKMNCEDIAIAMMVTEFLETYGNPQSCCLSMHAKHYPYNLEAQNRGSSFRGLSMRRTHVKGRTECLNDFVKFYKDGRLPLRYTHSRLIHEPKNTYYTEKEKH